MGLYVAVTGNPFRCGHTDMPLQTVFLPPVKRSLPCHFVVQLCFTRAYAVQRMLVSWWIWLA